jgi:MoxR-like ATPase
MSLPNELTNIFAQRQRSYKMVLILAILNEMNVKGQREVSFSDVKSRFLALLQERESQGLPVDTPPGGKATWGQLTPSQLQDVILNPINALTSIIDYSSFQQTIGFKEQLYNQWDQDILIELYDHANQELDAYYINSGTGFSLRNTISRIMSEYVQAKREPFSGHALGELVRRQVPAGIQDYPFIHSQLKIQGSVGMGNWATVPWIAILDRRITETTQHGEYIVYLFAEDMSKVYLTLAQGVTLPIKDKGKAEGYRYLQEKANELRELLPLEGLIKNNEIHLTSRGLGQDYQASTIAYYQYDIGNLPSDQQLVSDLQNLVENYQRYVNSLTDPSNKPAFSYTIARFRYGQGILHYLSTNPSASLDELTDNHGSILRSGDDVKHPKVRVSHIGRALQDLGLLEIVDSPYRLTSLGEEYVKSFNRDIWEISAEQAKLVRSHLESGMHVTPLYLCIKLALRIAKELTSFTLEDFKPRFIDGLEMQEEWNEVTQANRAKFMLGWLEDLRYIRKEEKTYIWNSPAEEELPVVQLSVVERIVSIQNFIQQKGFAYPDHLIENFYLALKTKPFVILAGVSGTGKTKLVKLFAEAIGATSTNNQFTLIPVRPDWSDPSDLLGYKDLSGKFRPGPLTKVLFEANHPENLNKPYFICLDEMNLARVEHYLSDVLSILETQEWKGDRIVTDSFITATALEEEDEQRYGNIHLSENVYLIGTVNMDETTHPFSKKVLDRANTIEFNYIDLAQYPEMSFADPSAPVAANAFLRSDYLQLVEVYAEHKELVEQVTEQLVMINGILESIHSHVGFRIRDAICFSLIYNKRFELLPQETAFDLQLLQKILPRIQGSNLSVKRVLLRLLEITLGKQLPKEEYMEDSSGLLHDADNLLKTAKYPLSSKKLIYMLWRLDEDGFTSYWLS